jgi:hypothetical protein
MNTLVSVLVLTVARSCRKNCCGPAADYGRDWPYLATSRPVIRWRAENGL